MKFRVAGLSFTELRENKVAKLSVVKLGRPKPSLIRFCLALLGPFQAHRVWGLPSASHAASPYNTQLGMVCCTLGSRSLGNLHQLPTQTTIVLPGA